MKKEETCYTVAATTEDEKPILSRPIRPQIYMAVNFLFSASLLGMSVAHSAVLIPQLHSENTGFTIEEDLGSWIVSVYSIVGPLGALLGGFACDALGRKRTHIIADFFMFMGWLMIAFAQNGYMILCARILEGVARSVASTANTVLADELSDPKYRGLIICGTFASASTGILIISVFGATLDWRTASGLVAGLAFVSLSMFCFVSESPTWLIRMNKNKKAEDVLRKLWGPGCEKQAEEEYDNLKAGLHTEDDGASESFSAKMKRLFSVLLKPYVIKPFLILHFFNAIQAFCGINLFTFYTIDILSKTAEYGVDIVDIYYTNIIISSLRTVVTFISCYLIFYLGRRQLALTSGVFSFVPALIVGFLLLSNKGNDGADSAVIKAYVTYILIIAYTVGMSLGFFILPGIMLGETQYYKIRGLVCGFIYTINDLLLGIMLKLYPWLLATFDIHGIFFMFGISCLICTIFVYLFIPETHGLSLQQIEDYFRQPNIMWITRKRISQENDNIKEKEDLKVTSILLE